MKPFKKPLLEKPLPSKRFPRCTYAKGEDTLLSDLVLLGFAKPFSLFVSAETSLDTRAVETAAAFFDRADYWNAHCRELLLSFQPGSEEGVLLEEYFKFFREEFPKDLGEATKKELVKRLRFKGMASYERGLKQRLAVDFTLRYHQVLCMKFDAKHRFADISWDSRGGQSAF